MSGPFPQGPPPPPHHPMPPAQQHQRPGPPPEIIQIPPPMRQQPDVETLTDNFRNLNTSTRTDNRRQSLSGPPPPNRRDFARRESARRESTRPSISTSSGPASAKDGSPVIYEGWNLTKATDLKGQDPKWHRAVRNLMNADHAELRSLIAKSKERQAGIQGLEQYQRLTPTQQSQIDRLIEDRKKEEKDPRVQWGYGLVETTERDGKKGNKRILETRAITVILRKKLPQDAQFPFGIPGVNTKLSGTVYDLLAKDDKKDKDKEKDKDKDKKRDNFATLPGSTITNPDGRRFFVSQDGTMIPIDQHGRPVVITHNGPQPGQPQGPHGIPQGPQGAPLGPQGHPLGPPQQGGHPGPIPQGRAGPLPGGPTPGGPVPGAPIPPHLAGMTGGMGGGRGGGGPQIQVIDDNMVPGPPPQHGGGRRGTGVPPIQIPPSGEFMGEPKSGRRGKSPKIVNPREAAGMKEWLNKGRRPHDSSEEDDESLIFEGDERSSFTEDYSDGSDGLYEKVSIPRRGSLPRQRRGSNV